MNRAVDFAFSHLGFNTSDFGLKTAENYYRMSSPLAWNYWLKNDPF